MYVENTLGLQEKFQGECQDIKNIINVVKWIQK